MLAHRDTNDPKTRAPEVNYLPHGFVKIRKRDQKFALKTNESDYALHQGFAT